ncbi:hypothetical protein TWF694_004984 [Orbilia ellipsospora]|uniref:AMP-activated protein kinase glycogen-binding domain-containing protein n=1 Tax=Orbilia ellipsospora TaxID=2528407 RepID=A0AAV9X0B1_9PEZI
MSGQGTYTFKWSQPAQEVFVTGSFDNWTKSQKLEELADKTHSATVSLPLGDKITYKYVVDGNWTFDSSQRVEKDSSGNDNNYLLPEDINPHEEPIISVPVVPVPDTVDESVTPFVSSVGPMSTTAALAAEVPLEPKAEKEPEPEVQAEKVEEPTEAPIVATVSTVGPEATTAALAAEVPLEEKAAEPPIVPEAIKAVVPEDLPTPDPKAVPGFLPDTADEEVGVHPLPASETPGNPIHLEPNEPVPPVTSASITDNVHLDEEHYNHPDASNLGVGATATAALAAVTGAITSAVASSAETAKNLIPESVLPIISKAEPEDHTTATTEVVPPVVIESQTKAEVEPEASANPVAVEAKKEVEEELVEKTELAAPVVVESKPVHAEVPEVVRESQVAAEAPLEASASPVAVEAKKEIEAELIAEVKPAEPIAEVPTSNPSEPEAVPAVVVASIEKAGEPSEAVASPVVVEQKAAVEEAIKAQETKPETIEPPTKEEPKEEPTAVEKVTETAAATADKVADKVEPTAPAEGSNGATAAAGTTSPSKDKEEKKKRRVSAFFRRIANKLK